MPYIRLWRPLRKHKHMDAPAPTEYPFKIVPFFTDFGFKTAFDVNGLFVKKAVQALAGLPHPVTHLEMLRNEFSGLALESKAGIYDVICRDEKYRVYILEMQARTFKWLPQRLMFYNFHIFNSQVKKGERSFVSVRPVICVCILKNTMYPAEPGKYVWRFLFQDESGKVFSEGSQVHLAELGKFPILQKDFHLAKTDAEKLFYTMKYAHLIDPQKPEEVPGFFNEPWLAEALNKLDLAKMSSLDRALLDIAIVKERMARAEREDELKEVALESEKRGVEIGEKIGEKRGVKRGMKIGEKRGMKRGVDVTLQILQLYKSKMTEEEIAKELDLPRKEIKEVIAKLNKIGWKE